MYEKNQIRITTDGTRSMINFAPEFMSLEKFQSFLDTYQKVCLLNTYCILLIMRSLSLWSRFAYKEYLTEAECKEIIRKYEPSECRDEFKFTLYGFLNYMNDFQQHIHTPQKETFVYQDMNHPFSHYFINSSHNT